MKDIVVSAHERVLAFMENCSEADKREIAKEQMTRAFKVMVYGFPICVT
jgi:hypothetical protein